MKLDQYELKSINKGKVPIVCIDSSLEKYKDKVLFKDKLDKANHRTSQVNKTAPLILYPLIIQ